LINKAIRLIYWYIKLNILRPIRRENSGVGLVVGSFDKGGLEQVVLNLYKGYRKMGHKAYIIVQGNHVGDFAKQLEYPNHLRIINNNPNELMKFCYENNIRILHYHYNTYMMRLCKFLNFKLFYTIHNTYLWFNDSEWKSYSELLKYCDKIIAVSDWAKAFFMEKSKLQNVMAIYNGIDINKFRSNYPVNYKREQFGLNNDDIVFVNVASINEAKHQMALVGVMEKIIKTRRDIKILLVGNILNHNYYEEIKSGIEASEAKENVKFVKYIPQDSMGCFLRAIPDAFVLPSLYECGVPLSVIEGLICGLPVVMTDLGVSNNEIMKGSIFPVTTAYDNIYEVSMQEILELAKRKDTKNIDQLAEKIVFVADNRKEIKTNMDTRKFEIYNLEDMIERYVEVLYGKH